MSLRSLQPLASRSAADVGRRLHLAGEFVAADRPRIPNGGRESLPPAS